MIEIFESLGALRQNGHFIYTAGDHGPDYFNTDILFREGHQLALICHAIAQKFAHKGVEVVIGPAVGGALIAQLVAADLRRLTRRPIQFAYAEKSNSGFTIRQTYLECLRGRDILVVEDVINTSKSLREVVDAVKRASGCVIGAAAIVNRGWVTAEKLNIPLLTQELSLKLESYPEAACPLCAAGVPINTDVGHGREFLE